jgi:hypothetical protein
LRGHILRFLASHLHAILHCKKYSSMNNYTRIFSNATWRASERQKSQNMAAQGIESADCTLFDPECHCTLDGA